LVHCNSCYFAPERASGCHPEKADMASLTNAENYAWRLLLEARERFDHSAADVPFSINFRSDSEKIVVADGVQNSFDLVFQAQGRWRIAENLPASTRHYLELYLPVFGDINRSTHVVGHLGQSLDAQIATHTGDAFFVTGEQNRKHLHKLRSLCHAVIVGANTVAVDNPQLTARAVQGRNPVRVVIDPQARLDRHYTIFNDKQALTYIVHQSNVDTQALNKADRDQGIAEQVKRLIVPNSEQHLCYESIVTLLGDHHLTRLLVEGGGITVSRFLQANSLHRLQLAVAPLLVGAGRPAIQIPSVDKMMDSMRAPFQLYRMGDDVMWDFDLSCRAGSRSIREAKIEADADEKIGGAPDAGTANPVEPSSDDSEFKRLL